MESVLTKLEELLQLDDFVIIRRDIRPVIQEFKKKIRERNMELQKEFMAAGGKDLDDFKTPKHPEEDKFEELMNTYGEKKEAYQALKAEQAAQRAERQKQQEALNVKKIGEKELLFKELEELLNTENQTTDIFPQVRDLQAKWKAVGRTTGDKALQLQSDYNHKIEVYFYNRKLANEMRDIDFTRNLAAKEALLLQIDELRSLESIDKMASLMRKYQAEWNAVGQVPWDNRDSVYERFRTMADEIYAKIKGFYDGRRQDLRDKLQQKIILCERVTTLLPPEGETISIKKWQEHTDTVLEVQNEWKTIGFSEENEKAWQAFRASCDSFFDAKRHFFDNLDETRIENKAKKETLCEQAEAVKDSTEWKKTTDELITLQKDWKKIGPAPRDIENKLWERFRGACDAFFNAKKEYFDNIGEIEAENLVAKQAIIDEINAFESSDNVDADFQTLKGFSNRWNAIGFVPFKQKDTIYQTYNKALDAKYDALKINREERKELRYQSRLTDLVSADNSKQLMNKEQTGIRRKIERIQNDIGQYENNLGFFKSSNKSNPLKKSIEDKIVRLRKDVADLKKQLRMLKTAQQQPKPAPEVVAETTEAPATDTPTAEVTTETPATTEAPATELTEATEATTTENTTTESATDEKSKEEVTATVEVTSEEETTVTEDSTIVE